MLGIRSTRSCRRSARACSCRDRTPAPPRHFRVARWGFGLRQGITEDVGADVGAALERVGALVRRHQHPGAGQQAAALACRKALRRATCRPMAPRRRAPPAPALGRTPSRSRACRRMRPTCPRCSSSSSLRSRPPCRRRATRRRRCHRRKMRTQHCWQSRRTRRGGTSPRKSGAPFSLVRWCSNSRCTWAS